MGRIWILLVLAGCTAFPQVPWPEGPAGPAPALLPLDEVLGPQGGGQKARVAEGL
jgi:hypothetical protein